MTTRAYYGERKEIVDLVPRHSKYVLDVGCGRGLAGAAIKAKTCGKVYGIELDIIAASSAKTLLDEVFIGDVNDFFNAEPTQKYDCIIFADILEHLIDPWNVLTLSRQFLSEHGIVILSIPNIRYYTTFYYLFFKAEWPYHESGIHDKTHLRFFTRTNCIQLINSSGFKVQQIKPYYLIANKKTWLNKLRRFVGIPGIRSFFTFQYHIVAVQK